MLAAQSCPTLVTSWTVARLAPLSMDFSSQEYWSGEPFPSPGDLPDLDIEPESPALQADSSLDLSQKAEKRCRQVLYHKAHLGSCNTK